MRHRATFEHTTTGNIVAWCTCGQAWTDETMMMTLVWQHLEKHRGARKESGGE
jgi:hypothetical protein